MPFFGRRGNGRKLTVNVKPTVGDNSPPPPPYQCSQPTLQQPQGTGYAHPNTPYESPSGLIKTPTTSSLAIPTPRRHRSTPQAGQKWASCTNLAASASCPVCNKTAEFCNVIGDKFSDTISLIDEEVLPRSQREVIFTFDPDQWQPPASTPHAAAALHSQHTCSSGLHRSLGKSKPPKRPKPSNTEQTTTQQRSINVLSKISLYTNSRLPLQLPPLRLYTSTYPIICLAAQYSNTAYTSPSTPFSSEYFIAADSRLGTKAMILKAIPIDDMNTIVFAIRGTSLLSLRDWGVNWHTDPVSPSGFLDDVGNLCHRGFLKVAKAMIKPIATRLRHLLEENPSRAACSLVITGHSAGGAVAALLYAHMMSQNSSVVSDLTILTECFKRVHCVTFGAPPISLLPLSKPSIRRLQKSVFLSFINEGDPVVRAEKAYIRSLVELLATCPPRKTSFGQIWKLPIATLSNAGRLVLLRVPETSKLTKGEGEQDRDITAKIVTDEQLRGVVFGNPLVHAMEIYERRVKVLAIRSATGKMV